MTEFKSADRTQASIMAAAEKRVLIWLAQRMPPWVNSDHLTAIGFLGQAAAGLSYWYAKRDPFTGLLLVILFLVVNWFGDSLDGTLARVRDLQRPRYGFYLDHILDSIGSVFLLGGLGLSGYMSPEVGAGLLIAYLLLSIEVFLATYTLGKFRISFGAFSPTELRILLIVGNLVALWRPMVNIAGRYYLLFDAGGVCGIVGMTAILIGSTVRHTRQLYREETRW
ncbi:MAG: CDP-alcohol phosphatidyltransferase family protein [Candidatus Solibacter usitatus]|nr:CDP-alcohol phosphatidyltransferase family protein [Candidatus Solibacter usitatus]